MTQTSDIDKSLSTILETEYEVVESNNSTEIISVEEQLPAVIKDTDRDIAYDYELSRITHRELIERGSELLENVSKVAAESQHPRAYEVAVMALKTLSDVTDKLMVLHEKKKALENNVKRGGNMEAGSVNVEQAVFVGSTSELLKQIRKDKS